MKLRNKETGVIYDLSHLPQIHSVVEMLLDGVMEKYEEPKEYWRINCTGEVLENNKPYCNTVTPEKLQSIGNYFETREEAEKAVALLKRIAIIKSYGCNVYEYINNTVLSIENYYERNKDEKRICR